MLEVKRKPAIHSQSATGPAHVHPVTETSSIEPTRFRGKLPVITGECHFKGTLSVDGLLAGQIGGQNGIRLQQRPSTAFIAEAELEGEFSFKDMVRINGHIAGKVYSQAGTIIVDAEAKVDANLDVGVAVIGGTLKGNIIARERVELGPTSRIYGNIWTRAIVIRDGAIFEGTCHMIADKKRAV